MEIADLQPGAHTLVDRPGTASERVLATWRQATLTLNSLRVWRQLSDFYLHPRPASDTWLVLPLEGSVELLADGSVYPLSSGRFAVVPARGHHAMRYAPGCSAWSHVSVHLTVRDPLGCDLLGWPAPQVGSVSPSLLTHWVDVVGLFHRDPAVASWWAHQLVLELLLGGGLELALPPQGDPMVAAALALLEQEPNLRIADLARRLRLGPSRLRERFVARTGLSPKAWQLTRLLERAADRVARGHEPIHVVAKDLGFANPQWFHRRFRQHHGCTPSEWRARNSHVP
jgi:AraC-like DNA-binding protein